MIRRLFLLPIFIVLYAGAAYGFLGCDEDCTKCHTLSKDEAKNILLKINSPDSKILKIQMSPVRGLWEVAVDKQGQKGLFYVDFSKRYIIAGPIFDVNSKANKSNERLHELASVKRVDISRITLNDALVLGDRKAAKRIIVFTDPECPFCSKFHAEIKKVIEKRKDIAFYIKLFPLVKIHPDSYWKSKTIMCSRSLKLLEDNYEKRPISKVNCDAKDVDENIKLAEKLGITGTPAVIMPDGSVYGFMEADKLIKIADSVKKKG